MEPKSSLEKNVSKKGYLHSDKKFWPIFPRIIEYDKPQGTTYKVSHSTLTDILQVIRSFIYDLRGGWKPRFEKKPLFF